MVKFITLFYTVTVPHFSLQILDIYYSLVSFYKENKITEQPEPY